MIQRSTELKTQWRLGAGQVSLLNSATLAASAVGAIIFGRVAGILGRTKIYGYEVLILAIVGSCRDRTPSIPSIESTREQSPGDDLFHEPEAQPEFVTAEAPSRDHPTWPPLRWEGLPLLIQAGKDAWIAPKCPG